MRAPQDSAAPAATTSPGSGRSAAPERPRVDLEGLARRAWELWSEANSTFSDIVVRPSAPVLFFGDSMRYLSSPLRVITVGLNPSRIEFDGPDPFHRFPGARDISPGNVSGKDMEGYLQALNVYFETDPYWDWFRHYRAVLQGCGADFAPGASNTALHTDICSPVATSPTWSRLSREHRAARDHLARDGVDLWHELVSLLAPDVIIMSIRARYREAVRFPRLGEWKTIYTVERTNPHITLAAAIEVAPGKETLLVHGRAANAPFATVKDVDKVRIGGAVRRLLDGG